MMVDRLAIIAALVAIAMPTVSHAEGRFAESWNEEMRVDITRTLIQHGVKGCSFYKHKESLDTSGSYAGSYIVYCSRDKRRWEAYLVWPDFDMVMGPSKPDPKYK